MQLAHNKQQTEQTNKEHTKENKTHKQTSGKEASRPEMKKDEEKNPRVNGDKRGALVLHPFSSLAKKRMSKKECHPPSLGLGVRVENGLKLLLPARDLPRGLGTQRVLLQLLKGGLPGGDLGPKPRLVRGITLLLHPGENSVLLHGGVGPIKGTRVIMKEKKK